MYTKSILAVALVLICTATLASLGDDASSVRTDHIHIGGRLLQRTAQTQAFTIQELQPTSDGTIIREFVSPQGKVFAVSWKGPLMPDLRQLLGNYFQPYVDSLQTQNNHHLGMAHVQTDGLVVQSTGRLRAFSGIAYLPGELPAGVTVQDLQQ